jgi:site-specific DNA-methyltransferase (adenine-specific)
MAVAESKVAPDVKERSRLTKEEWREFTRSVWSVPNVSHPTHPAVFPIEIGRRLVRLFSFHDELVVDPFCGVGTTGVAAVRNGRRFYGQELKQPYVQLAREALAAEGSDSLWQIRRADSRKITADRNSVDLIVTSPPYWNKANYGGGRRDLGALTSYEKFLSEMAPIFRECYRVLRPGRRFCVVTANVNQHTTEGLLTYPLATDFINLGRRLGFLLVNQIVWSKEGTGGRWGSANGQRPIFGSYPYPPNFMFKNVHEFILIFKKPNRPRTHVELIVVKR